MRMNRFQRKHGSEQSLEVLRGTAWDGGFISEGVDPDTVGMEYDGRAFATAAWRLVHPNCQSFCKE